MLQNVIVATDAHKMTQHCQYPPGLTKLYSYGATQQGSKFPTVSWFGLEASIVDHLLTPITAQMIDAAAQLSQQTFGTTAYFNRDVWEKVAALGHLPIKITALPTGVEVPTGTALFTLESTQPWFATTMPALETVLMHVWYPTTIATHSLYLKRALQPLFEQSGVSALVDKAVNDFGLRGSTSLVSGARGGGAHLRHFTGSATVPARDFWATYYQGLRGVSIRSTEHSVATAFGAGEGESNYLAHQLAHTPEDVPLSIVIDSYDAIGFIRNIVPEYKAIIQQRSGRTVFRPDSGDIQKVVLEVLEGLAHIFGTTINAKGYRVLRDNVGVIQGDGMNFETIVALYQALLDKGWSVENVTTGSGGGLLQENFTHHTLGLSIQASYAEIDGQAVNMQKKDKTAKTGRLKVIFDQQNGWQTVSEKLPGHNQLRTIYENGVFYPENAEQVLARGKEIL